MQYPTLNYPPIHLRARRNADGRIEVFDRVRGRWLVLTPEEWVRRHVVEFLKSQCGYNAEQIVEEYPVNINGMAQRADIVVVDRCGRPHIIVECKESNIKIDREVFYQAVRYNTVLKSRYIVLTNGIETLCYAYNEDGSYTPMKQFPHNTTEK